MLYVSTDKLEPITGGGGVLFVTSSCYWFCGGTLVGFYRYLLMNNKFVRLKLSKITREYLVKKSSLIFCMIAFMGLVACSEKEVSSTYGFICGSECDPPDEPCEYSGSFSGNCPKWCEYHSHGSPQCPGWCDSIGDDSPECPANSVNGYWSGYGTDEVGNAFEVEAIFLGGTFISVDADSIVSGEYTIDNGELLSMDTKIYEIDGPYVDNIQINSNQTVYGKSRITADVVLADENSTLDIGYEAFSETTISYSDLAGDWYFDSDNELTYIAAVDEQGAFNSVVDECTISGSISIPTTNLFIFDVELTIAGDECEVIGSYDGLGVLYEDQINMFYTNDEYGFNSILLRQDPNDVANTSRD